MKLSALIFAMTLSLSSWAASFEVLQVTNDKDKRLVTLYIETNENGDLASLRQITVRQDKSVENIAISEAEGRKGFALCKEGNLDVITLKVMERFEPVYGGPVKLVYLVNGIKGSRATIELEAVREGNKWVIKNNGAIVKKAHVVSNKILGKVIGVSKIQF